MSASLQPTYVQSAISIAQLLPTAAQLHPTSGIHFPSAGASPDSHFLSYPAMLDESLRILQGLQGRLAPAAKVALFLDRPRDFLPALWACLIGGYVPCPLAPLRGDPQRWSKHVAHVDGLLGQPLFVSSAGLIQELPENVTSVPLNTLCDNPPAKLGQTRRAGLALLMLTSGSTGNAKAVELTHANLLASLAGRAERQQLTHADTMLNWIAFDHVAALLESHMIAQYVGATQVHADPTQVLADPLEFLRLIQHHRVTVAFAPNFLLGQVNAALQSRAIDQSAPLDLDLSTLRRIVTGGEANVVETGLRFLKLLAPLGLAPDALWPAFGMTETCAASVYSDEFPTIDAANEFATVGRAIAGMNMRIVDEHGTEVAEGGTGELQVSGPIIFHRYHNNETATRDAFTSDGWFRTGDLGRIVARRLSLIARTKDSIIVSGVNYFSHELEAELERLDGIKRSFVAAFPTRPKGADTEQLVITFATTFPVSDESRLFQLVVAIRNTTIMLWGFRPAVILPLPEEAFPKTSLGKIQRTLMRKRYEDGAYAAQAASIQRITTDQLGAHVAPAGDAETRIARIFATILGVDAASLSATTSFFDLGGTSLDILKLTKALERQLGVHASIATILQAPGVRELALRISAKPATGVTYDPIVPLQTTGTKTPLFFIHPGNGEVLVLVNLAKYFLNERPLYALRAAGFNEGEQCIDNVPDIVRTYLNAIVARRPHGPYAIAGYSLGSAIAFEIAKELEARGERVAFLGCVDWYPCFDPAPLTFNMAAGLAIVLGLITAEQYQQINDEFGTASPDAEVCKRALDMADPRRLAELDMNFDRFIRWARVAYSMEDLIYRHRTTGKTRNMTVFGSAGLQSFFSKDEWRALLERWDEFAIDCKQVEVAGDHHTVMSPKHVASFQAAFRAEVAASLGENP